ncbi:MAG: FtsX-like permease family protein [Oscillospiraceae bacterium]
MLKSIALYPKLAVTGIKNNFRTYLPYIITSAGMIMIYYIVSFLSASEFISEIPGSHATQSMLYMGGGTMIVFSFIFLFYTNSFLIKRRKTEFGLYNILGMSKRNIAIILVWETLMVFALSFAVGIISGVLFSKLGELMLTRMLGGRASYSFDVDKKAIISALISYAVIFFVIMLNALRQIRLSNPIELMKSENSGEKAPKANYVAAIIGFVILLFAYYIAITVNNPITAILLFFVAVIMVIIATYMLFTAGSVALCRGLQANKSYYYRTDHFVSVSQMAYRMKRNGAGLASICILATMVMVTISTTTCLYIGSDDMINSIYPRDICIDSRTANADNGLSVSKVTETVYDKLYKYGTLPQNEIHYGYIDTSGVFDGDKVYLGSDTTQIYLGLDTPASVSGQAEMRRVYFVDIADYNRIAEKNISLDEDEVALYLSGTSYGFDRMDIKDLGEFKVKEIVPDFHDNGIDARNIEPTVFVFVSENEILSRAYDASVKSNDKDSPYYTHFYLSFDLDTSSEKKIEVSREIEKALIELKENNEEITTVSVNSRDMDKVDFKGVYGGFFFLGILFGILFVGTVVLIMYYKQISEGYEDKSRFAILKKVGMTEDEIRKSINSQVLTVFFAPLVATGIHTVFAFPMISKMLMLFGLTNTTLFALVTLCCYAVFAILYVLVYFATSRSYYSIVTKK